VESGGGTITPAGVYTAPVSPGTFTVKAVLQADTSKIATAPVTVIAAPAITSFTATPSIIFPGQNGAALAPVFSGGAGTITPGVGTVTSGQTYPVNPSATTVYTLRVVNPAGDSVTQETRLALENRPPTITSFIATPPLVPYGQPLQLSWTLGGGLPTSVLLGGQPVLGLDHLVVNPTRRVRFELQASNPIGAAAPQSLTVAGQGLDAFAGSVWGGRGVEDGTGPAARTDTPDGLACDSAGNLFVTDWAMHTVRKVSPGGTVTTLAGQPGQPGVDDGPGSQARFRNPLGIAVDPSGNLWVCDSGNHCIRRITPAGEVSTFAGIPGAPGYLDGPAATARFASPAGIVLDGALNLYVTESDNSTLRKITPSGTVSTLAGEAGFPGSEDGTGIDAKFNLPMHLAIDGTGTLFLADMGNATLRRITPAGAVTTFAGTPGAPGYEDGLGAAARFSFPAGLALDPSGNLFVTDRGGNTLRKVTPGGVVTTVAGAVNQEGSQDGVGSAARFNAPWGLARDPLGNLFLGEDRNHTLRKVTPDFTVSTFLGRALEPGTADGAALAARFNGPNGAVADANSNVYIVDTFNHTIRKISAATGLVGTLAGSPGAEGTTNGTGPAASFFYPEAVAVDSQGNVFVAEDSHVIRKVTPAGVVSTFAGSPGEGDFADGTGPAARFFYPSGLAIDPQDNLYVADSGNYCVRKITPGGMVTTLAGQGGAPGSEDGTGGAARFGILAGLAIGPGGNLFVTDSDHATIRKITPAGAVTTLAGSAGVPGTDDGPAGSARFLYPLGIAADASGNVFVSDGRVLRRIAADGAVTTVAGSYTDYSSAGPGPLPGSLGRIRGLAMLGMDLLLATDHGLILGTAPAGE
jgi:sugar lactone lactonase YvrE